MDKPQLMDVTIDEINFDDRSYIFTFEPVISRMVASVEKAGVINPPILELKSDKSYRIISGLRRIIALRHLNISKFNAKVYASNRNEPRLALFLINFYENVGTRNLNAIEIANIMNKLIHVYKMPREQVVNEYLPLLELGTNPQVVDRYLPLVQLEDFIKAAVAEEFISIDIAHAFLKMSPEERLKLFELFNELKMGKNRQKEFVHLLFDIAAMSDTSILQLLTHEDVQKILHDVNLTPNVKINRIRDFLKRLRYPNYVKAEQEFNRLKKELKLPPNIILRPPPFFEGEKYTVEFKFKNHDEFIKLVNVLKAVAEQHKLKKLEKLV